MKPLSPHPKSLTAYTSQEVIRLALILVAGFVLFACIYFFFLQSHGSVFWAFILLVLGTQRLDAWYEGQSVPPFLPRQRVQFSNGRSLLAATVVLQLGFVLGMLLAMGCMIFQDLLTSGRPFGFLTL